MTFTLFTARKNEIGNAIACIQSQIALLQQQLADQQAFLQEIGSVESAAESALSQTRTFLSMVRAIDPTQESVFWASMDTLKSAEVEALAPGNDEITETDTPPATTPPATDAAEEPQTVEVEAVKVETQGEEEEDEAQITDSASTPNSTDDATQQPLPLTADQIKKITWKELQDYCAKKGVSDPTGQRLTRKFAEAGLLGKLTTADIA
jgi:hypothetical protein